MAGGAAVGVAAGPIPGAALGGATVVNVSAGSCGTCEGVGDALGGVDALVVAGAEVTGCGTGAPTVALVDALSPLFRTTAVATAPRAITAPRIAVTGRLRGSAGQPVQL